MFLVTIQGAVGSLGVLTAKAIGNVVSYEATPTPATAPLTTTFPSTSTLGQALQTFTTDGNSTSDPSGYSSVEAAVVLALLTGLWQVGSRNTGMNPLSLISLTHNLFGIPFLRMLWH